MASLIQLLASSALMLVCILKANAMTTATLGWQRAAVVLFAAAASGGAVMAFINLPVLARYVIAVYAIASALWLVFDRRAITLGSSKK